MNSLTIKLKAGLFILLGIFIPTSIAITNLIIAALSILWILEGDFRVKIKIIKSSKWMIAIFSLILLYLFGLFWGDFHSNAEWQFQRLALLLVFPLFATIRVNQKTLQSGALAFLITTFISALLAILINNNIISPLGEYIYFIKNNSEISAFVKYNYHNVLLALSFTLSLYLLIEKKTKNNKWLILFIIVYALSIFTERGRAGQVIFNLSAIFYIIYYNRRYLLRGAAFLIVLFSFQIIIYNSTNVYKDRFDAISDIIQNNGKRSEGRLEDIRYVFVRESLNKIVKKPFLGYGTGSFGTIFKNDINSGHYFDKHTTPHNQYLYVWFELGILGLGLLLSIFFHQIKELLSMKDGIHRSLLPISFLFLMLVDSYFFIFLLTIAYIYLYTIYSRYESE